MKILCVEDGSIDEKNLEKDLSDGKILVYRQGAQQPYVLEIDAPDFIYKKMWEGLKSDYSNAWNRSAHSMSAENIVDEMREYEKKYLGSK